MCIRDRVDIPRVSLGFVEVAIQAEAEFVAQRTGQAEVGAFGGTFLFMFWRIEISIPGAVPLTTAFFGNDEMCIRDRADARQGRITLRLR